MVQSHANAIGEILMAESYAGNTNSLLRYWLLLIL